MAMQPARALEKQIHRSKLANHQIEIEVKALFYDLGRDDQCAARALHFVYNSFAEIDACTVLADANQRTFLSKISLFERITRVE